MMTRRTIGMVVGLVGVVAAGCSANVGQAPAPEKTASTDSALIITNPTPPYQFPEAYHNQKPPFTCIGKLQYQYGTGNLPGILSSVDGENFLAIRTAGPYDNSGNADPYTTPYTHGYTFNETNCGNGDLRCATESDFFSIPLAHGFKYLVKNITSFSCVPDRNGRQVCTPITGSNQYYLSGVQRVDESWWTFPWVYWNGNQWVYQQCGGVNCPAPWTILDANSHPSYGNDAMSADWLELWNVAYTYSANGPNSKYTGNIEATHHQCAAIYNVDGYEGNAQFQDFFVAALEHDPSGPSW